MNSLKRELAPVSGGLAGDRRRGHRVLKLKLAGRS
jgi:hypothetical protein